MSAAYPWPRALLLRRWNVAHELYGEGHIRTKVAMARYVARIGGVVTHATHGFEPWLAWYRVRTCPGAHNRGMRRYLRREGIAL
jgi:hypothetical protein